MARKCDICGKTTMSGNSVSHSHKKTRRKWMPNLKKTKVKLNDKVEYKNVCTRCIRSNKIVKAI